MQKTVLKVSEIKNNPNNPRLIKDDKFKKLVKSIQEFPEMLDAREVVVNKDHIILGGNMRYKAAKEAGIKEIPVKIVDWDEDKQRQFVIKDNVSGGEWDWDMLANEFDQEELDDWGLDTPDTWGEDKEVEEDEAPEVDESEPPKSKLGEVYQLGRHRVMCADSTVRENVEMLMNGQKADMVFTDPPYGVSYQSNMRTKTEKFDVIKNDDVIDGTAIEIAYEHSTGWVLVCTGWTVLTKWLEIINDEVTNLIVWDKGGGGMGDLKHSLLTDYELIMAYNRGNEIVGKRLGSVWSIGKDFAGSYAHPTQKPVELPAQAIKTFSTGSVLDPFLGSGSTLIACEHTERTCYGMELDPKYVDVIRKRYHKFVTGNEEGWENGTPAI